MKNKTINIYNKITEINLQMKQNNISNWQNDKLIKI